MFHCERYVTKGVVAKIPAYLQNVMWYSIETMDVQHKDYIQVFRLRQTWDDGMPKQFLIHSQEQPLYHQEYTFSAKHPVKAKVFVIDDGTHSTMLLAEEY
ncbi:DUF960 family protein [Brevibacillus laterosporus]|uniref:DUF960 family protein n=1 Tax=Brevibacillus laterosporus TaxID=1465 RepID=UPI002E1F4F40|nr:DUF960 family protein [Brevibacillus laterosporus]